MSENGEKESPRGQLRDAIVVGALRAVEELHAKYPELNGVVEIVPEGLKVAADTDNRGRVEALVRIDVEVDPGLEFEAVDEDENAGVPEGTPA